MKLRNKIYFVLIVTVYFVAVMFFLVTAAKAGDGTANRTEQQSAAGPEQHKRTLVSVERWIVDGEVSGFIVSYIYTDVTTQRPADYAELYNPQGDLMAVSWFDEFGIQRTAIDRGIVEGEEKLEGIFVAVLDGDPI